MYQIYKKLKYPDCFYDVFKKSMVKWGLFV